MFAACALDSGSESYCVEYWARTFLAFLVTTHDIEAGQHDRNLTPALYILSNLFYAPNPGKLKSLSLALTYRINLVARPNVLAGGSSYTFRLSAVDSVSLETGKIFVHVSRKILLTIYPGTQIEPAQW